MSSDDLIGRMLEAWFHEPWPYCGTDISVERMRDVLSVVRAHDAEHAGAEIAKGGDEMRKYVLAGALTLIPCTAFPATVTYDYTLPCIAGSCSEPLAAISVSVEGSGFAPRSAFTRSDLQSFSVTSGTFSFSLPEAAGYAFGGFWGDSIDTIPFFGLGASTAIIGVDEIGTVPGGKFVGFGRLIAAYFDEDNNHVPTLAWDILSLTTAPDGACIGLDATCADGFLMGHETNYIAQQVVQIAPVPIPPTLWLMLAGLSSLFLFRRRLPRETNPVPTLEEEMRCQNRLSCLR